MEQPRQDSEYSTNYEQPEYVEDGPIELFGLWDEDALAWASDVYERAWFKHVQATYLEIKHRLKNEAVGFERSRQVCELYQVMALEGLEMG